DEDPVRVQVPRRQRGFLSARDDEHAPVDRDCWNRGPMREPRHVEPLPLGGNGLPYSKGLMARALIATGMPALRAYELSRRLDEDLTKRAESSVDLDRMRE